MMIAAGFYFSFISNDSDEGPLVVLCMFAGMAAYCKFADMSQ